MKRITCKQLRTQNPIQIASLKTIQNEYERSLGEEEGYKKVQWGSNQGMINRFKLVRKLLSGITYKRLLDIGCGTGDLFKVIKKRDKEYFAYDLNFHMVLCAQQNIRENVRYFVASSYPIPLKADSMDVVTLIGVLQNCGVSVDEVIAEIHRVVRPGGYVFLITKNLGWEKFIDGELEPEKGMNWFFDEDINISLRKYGFEIKEKGGFVNQTGRVTYMEKSHEIFYWVKKYEIGSQHKPV